MKKMSAIVGLLVLNVLSGPLAMPAFAANDHRVKVTVKGLVCAFCAQGIKKKFSADEAVQNVDVSLRKALVTVELKDGMQISDEKIQSTLKDSGYSISAIQRD